MVIVGQTSSIDGSWSRLKRFGRAFGANKGAWIGVGIIISLSALAVAANLVGPHPPNHQYYDAVLRPPAWQAGGSGQFPLGTDALGRDILSRVAHGARYSLAIGCIVVTAAMAIGVAVGLFAASAQRFVDMALMRVLDMVMAIPGLLLALVVVAVLGPGLFNVVVAVAIVLVPHFTRVTRAAALSELARDYVVATRIAGAGRGRIIFNAVLPNCMPPLIVQGTLSFSTAILDAAALGFLGMGAQPPTPEWGTMLADAREFILLAWWVVAFPGFAIMLTVLAFNLVGDGLRDALDPKLTSG
jgi:dipeptide transport system permease protein